jgi:hypothetical protein
MKGFVACTSLQTFWGVIKSICTETDEPCSTYLSDGHGTHKFSRKMYKVLQVTLVLRDFVLHDFALTRLENLHDFSNLRDNFRVNAIWHGPYVVALIEFTP